MLKKKVAIIGAGAMGLACAYDLLKNGHEVHIFEKDAQVGGMSASFDFDGLNVEKFYHFVCGPDYPLFAMMKELGIYDKLHWTETKMGFFYHGHLYKWGNPLYLLSFPQANLLDKMCYGLHLFLSSKRTKWDDLDKLTAKQWIKSFVSPKAYDIFWKPLFDLKFYDFKDNISAAWIWTRIKRVALSRKNLFTEQMGYIEGGSATLFTALSNGITTFGGKIYLNRQVDEITVENGKTTGLYADKKFASFDHVVSTVPLPYIPPMVPALPDELKQKYKSVNNVGVVCVILKLQHKLTENFWLNINDPAINIPGMIEYTNLNKTAGNILYVPFYLPKQHPKYIMDDQAFLNEVGKYVKLINPDFSDEWVLARHVHRYEYAQPVCTPRFLEMLPEIETGVKGLYIADTSHYYPEDRSISESIRIGREIATAISSEATS
jgi:protoporphyrinogen oxidase